MASIQFEINEEKEAFYRKLVNPQVMDDLKEKILHELIVKKKYKDGNFTARQLAAELGTNTRYLSAAVRVHFHTTYTLLVNKMRIESAMSILTDSRYADLNVDEVGKMVGFVHRQSFHTAFVKLAGMTPKAYRMHYKKQLSPVKKERRYDT